MSSSVDSSPEFWVDADEIVNSSNALEELQEISKRTLKLQIPSSIYWIAFGSVAIFTNALLIAAIVTQHNRLRRTSNFYCCVVHLSLADICSGIILVCIAVKRLYLALSDQTESGSPQSCAMDMAALDFAMQISVTQTFCLALDRFVAVNFPIFYQTRLTQCHLQPLNYFHWLFAICFSAYGSIQELHDVPAVPACILPAVYTSGFVTIMFAVISYYSIKTVVIYAQILLRVRLTNARKRHQRRWITSNRAKQQRQDAAILRTIGLIISACFFTWICSSVIATLLGKFASRAVARSVTPYLVGLTGFNGGTNLFFHLWKNPEIRKNVRTLLPTVLRRSGQEDSSQAASGKAVNHASAYTNRNAEIAQI